MILRGRAKGFIRIFVTSGNKKTEAGRIKININTKQWQSVKCSIPLPDGEYALVLHFETTGTADLQSFVLE